VPTLGIKAKNNGYLAARRPCAHPAFAGGAQIKAYRLASFRQKIFVGETVQAE